MKTVGLHGHFKIELAEPSKNIKEPLSIGTRHCRLLGNTVTAFLSGTSREISESVGMFEAFNIQGRSASSGHGFSSEIRLRLRLSHCSDPRLAWSLPLSIFFSKGR